MMKAGISKLVVLVLALMLTLPLAGCSDSKKLEEYNQGMADASAVITASAADFNKAMQAFGEGYSKEKCQAVIDAMTKMEAGYNQLGSLEPPDKFAEVQKSYRESAELFAQAAAIYKDEFGKVTADTVDEAFLERLKVGDEYLRQAQEKLMEGSAKGQEIENGK